LGNYDLIYSISPTCVVARTSFVCPCFQNITTHCMDKRVVHAPLPFNNFSLPHRRCGRTVSKPTISVQKKPLSVGYHLLVIQYK